MVVMENPVRVGFVGSRFAAKFHWEAIRLVYGVPIDIVGVTSKTPEARDNFARETGIRAFETFAELCAAVDVVDLCTPPSSHEELAMQALGQGKHVIIEKPLTGYYGAGSLPKELMLAEAVASCARILAAAKASGGRVCYAKNLVYAPAIQKEREIIQKSGGQILRIIGEESHGGSHSPYYGRWKFSGGGSPGREGCHPVSAALYLKRVEGESREGIPIRPATVSARTHEITRLPNFRDEGFLRTGYDDIEDYAQTHITFSDGTVADIFASELVMGGVSNWLEIFCNDHRTRCNMNPINAWRRSIPGKIFSRMFMWWRKSAPNRVGASLRRMRVGSMGIHRNFRTLWSVFTSTANLCRGSNWRGIRSRLSTPAICQRRRRSEVTVPS